MSSPKANLPSFNLPDFTANVAGWGPREASTENGILSEFDGLPYQQFNKADRVGRIVDWLGVDRYYKKSDTRKNLVLYTTRLAFTYWDYRLFTQ